MKLFYSFLFCLGFAQLVSAQIVVSGTITTNTTWTKNNSYLLSGFVYVKGGATLTIEPGTIIKGDKATKGTLIVTRGAKIIANANRENPIVFTSNQATPDYGDWGGIIILGKANTNQKVGNTTGLGTVEGGVNNAAGDGIYGGGDLPAGADDNDNSGILNYVRIEYPGIAFTQDNEINGLTMAGVGAGTKIEYVQVSYSGDDSFEWFGGNVNCRYLIAYRGLDDDFDCDFGFRGKVQFGLSVRNPSVADAQSGSNGFEVDNDATGTATAPKTSPVFSNMTIVGPTGTVSASYRRAAHLRRNNEIKLFNSVFVGSYPVGLLIEDKSTMENAIAGKMRVKNCHFYGQTKQIDTTKAGGLAFDIATWFTASNNVRSAVSADAKMVDPFNLSLPNATLAVGSPLLTAASFADSNLVASGLTTVSYVGAFDRGGNWTCGWAKFATESINCITGIIEDEATVQTLKLTPSAASYNTTLTMEIVEATPLQVRVIGINGQLVEEITHEKVQTGTFTHTFDVSSLPAGLYFVQVVAGQKTHSEKFVVVK
jgi:Secretion system C-terminal sorting domain